MPPKRWRNMESHCDQALVEFILRREPELKLTVDKCPQRSFFITTHLLHAPSFFGFQQHYSSKFFRGEPPILFRSDSQKTCKLRESANPPRPFPSQQPNNLNNNGKAVNTHFHVQCRDATWVQKRSQARCCQPTNDDSPTNQPARAKCPCCLPASWDLNGHPQCASALARSTACNNVVSHLLDFAVALPPTVTSTTRMSDDPDAEDTEKRSRHHHAAHTGRKRLRQLSARKMSHGFHGRKAATDLWR